VVAHRGPAIGVGRGLLDVSQWDTGVERGGDARVPQRVRPDGLVDPGTAGEPHDPPGSVTVETRAVSSKEDRSLDALADREVDRPGGARS
jgi:hypothetical protein